MAVTKAEITAAVALVCAAVIMQCLSEDATESARRFETRRQRNSGYPKAREPLKTHACRHFAHAHHHNNGSTNSSSGLPKHHSGPLVYNGTACCDFRDQSGLLHSLDRYAGYEWCDQECSQLLGGDASHAHLCVNDGFMLGQATFRVETALGWGSLCAAGISGVLILLASSLRLRDGHSWAKLGCVLQYACMLTQMALLASAAALAWWLSEKAAHAEGSCVHVCTAPAPHSPGCDHEGAPTTPCNGLPLPKSHADAVLCVGLVALRHHSCSGGQCCFAEDLNDPKELLSALVPALSLAGARPPPPPLP